MSPDARLPASWQDAGSTPYPAADAGAFLGRLVVLVVIAAVALAVAAAAFASSILSGGQQAHVPYELAIGPWTTRISTQVPTAEVVGAAFIAMTAIAVTAILLEAIAAVLSISPTRDRLSRLRAERTGGSTPKDRIHVTVLVPAHNEELALPGTLGALAAQSCPPDRVIVIADNCTDGTTAVAAAMGHESFETVGNTSKKGGALNQALRRLLPVVDPRDAILVVDADTQLAPDFIAVAARQLHEDPELAAVGGLFYGEDGHGVIGQLQRNEYARYGSQIRARRGRVFVLTGTATMFRAGALKDVAAARGTYLPGTPGAVYDTTALTEDNELTLALKTLGATMRSPAECQVTTELMPTWRNLWRQRQRWQRGALENLGAYGMTRATLRYWGQQVGIGYGTVALNAAILLILTTALAIDNWIWFPFWMAVGAVFAVERTLTAWKSGWRGRILAALVLPELFYDVFLQAVFVSSLAAISLNRQAQWGHVNHGSALENAGSAT